MHLQLARRAVSLGFRKHFRPSSRSMRNRQFRMGSFSDAKVWTDRNPFAKPWEPAATARETHNLSKYIGERNSRPRALLAGCGKLPMQHWTNTVPLSRST
jgi:hypothetical protein